MEAKDISIIIPCYNSGKFLTDAIQSVEKYDGIYKVEIIIVNDGSTDEMTLNLLNKFELNGYHIIHQSNKGPAAARNRGIYQSKSNYILFLDSDNKIRPEYIDEGINLLRANDKVGVVYGNAVFFGDNSRNTFITQPFNIKLLLSENYIDMCAVVRKAAWLQVGGLDEDRSIIGHEDWDFWLNLYKKGWDFLHIDKQLFEYRVRNDSLVTQTTNEIFQNKINYIHNKHSDLLSEQYFKLMQDSIIYNYDKNNPFRSALKYLWLALNR